MFHIHSEMITTVKLINVSSPHIVSLYVYVMIAPKIYSYQISNVIDYSPMTQFTSL